MLRLVWVGLLQPVLAVTASILKPDQEMCMRTGYQGVISKPIAVKAIASQVPQTLPLLFLSAHLRSCVPWRSLAVHLA